METVKLIDNEIFVRYGEDVALSIAKNNNRPMTFDPLTNLKNLNEAKMDDRLSQKEYKNITPWRALTEVIAVPVVMMTFLIAVKINILVKLLLIFMIIIQIIISTCLVSYLSKNYIKTNNETLKINNKHE